MRAHTTGSEFFEGKYLASDDPWLFASSAYEEGRYAAIIAALDHRRYRHAFEPGCSIGVLTSQLAGLCDRVDAVDLSPTAVQRALLRCAGLENVSIECGSLPECILRGPFDLVVLSEVGYYFTEWQLRDVLGRLLQELAPSGTMLAAHWLGRSEDHVLSGDRVHDLLATFSELEHEYAGRHTGFRLDRWRKR